MEEAEDGKLGSGGVSLTMFHGVWLGQSVKRVCLCG